MTRPDTPTEDAVAAEDTQLADAGLPGGTGEDGTVRRPERRVSLAHRLYNGEAGLDVVGHSRLIYKITAVVMVLCIGSIIFRGFNFGIEFDGGSSFKVAGHSQELSAVRAAAEKAGAPVSSAQVVGTDTILLRTGQLTNDETTAVKQAIASAAGVQEQQVSEDAVSAAWGNDITDQALIALVVFLVAVVLFLAIRFQPKMAIGAMASLLHDIVLTAGVYSLIGFEVTPSTVIGFLTILGFSLYDTVVVYDKVGENSKDILAGSRTTYSDAANLAVNQTLMRSINTSLIALLPVGGLLFIGAGLLGVGTIKDLALILFVGLASGAYSSLFLATPIVVDLTERTPEHKALTKRVAAKRASDAKRATDAELTGAAAAARRAGGPAPAPRVGARPEGRRKRK